MTVPKITVVQYQERAIIPVAGERRAHSNVSKAAKFCSVYLEGSALGFKIFPPFSARIRWRGGYDFDVQTEDSIESYLWAEHMREIVGVPSGWWCSKIAGVMQIDLGLILKTPPGWKLLVTGVANRPHPSYWMHTGLLDSDWFHVPSTVNLQMSGSSADFHLSRDEAIGQIVPIASTAVTDSSVSVETFSNEHPSSSQWLSYLHEVYGPDVAKERDPKRLRIGTYMEMKRHVENQE